MSKPVWYRSLYWRIAIGFVALLAALLRDPGRRLLWLTVVVGRSSLGPAQLAAGSRGRRRRGVGARSSARHRRHYVPDRFGRIYQPFLVVMHDGRPASNRPTVCRRVSPAWRVRATAGGMATGRRPAQRDAERPDAPPRGDVERRRTAGSSSRRFAPGGDASRARRGARQPASAGHRACAQFGPTLACGGRAAARTGRR